jgi:nucleoside-diphosphate-sugar epimerase
VALRPTWVYGPGDLTFTPEIVDAMAKGVMVYLGHRTNFIYTIYIDNLVDAIVLALEKDKAIGRGYLVSDDTHITWEQFCTELADGLSLRPPWITIPRSVIKGFGAGLETAWTLTRQKNRPLVTRYSASFLGTNLRYSDQRIRDELGFSSKIKLEEAMKRTIEWLKSQPVGKMKIK